MSSKVERSKPQVSLPDARYFAVTWGIPDSYGGMTSVLLHRSRAFHRLGGTAVDILTFDARCDYPALEQNLRDRGELLPGQRLINLWDWLRANETPASAPGSLRLERHPFTPLASGPDHVSAFRDGRELTRTRLADDGDTVLQVDYYRLDGTLLACDRRDTLQRGTLGGRSVVLCDGSGAPVRSWGSVWGLYRFWLDRLRGDALSIMIVDSKTAARFMLGYRRENAVTVHVVHGTHLSDDDPTLIRASRREVFARLADFDSVVVLTRRQKSDIERLLGPVPHLTVIPNSSNARADVDVSAARDLGRGVVLASLSALKRVDHAVRATIRAAGESEDSAHPLSLDIFGDGDQRAAIEQLIRDRNATNMVRLHGYRSDARRELAEASFLLLTSRSEAFALVLLESMAAGCIPIAYDVPYGPADIITNGRNGFLVPAGDEAALTAAIEAFQRLSPAQVAKLRKNAQRTAERFTDLAVTRQWARELRRAVRRKAQAARVR
jgi:poly(glycerol-phosphate) alpha-glucosyltransferase